jgi:hypothetical protein
VVAVLATLAWAGAVGYLLKDRVAHPRQFMDALARVAGAVGVRTAGGPLTGGGGPVGVEDPTPLTGMAYWLRPWGSNDPSGVVPYRPGRVVMVGLPSEVTPKT